MDNFLLSYLEEKYGVQKETPLYCKAQELLQRLWQGSVCIPADESLANSEAVGKKGEARPLIYHEGNLYIQRYFVYQTRILEKIKELKIHIITGGPGTGKTTSLAKILKDRLNEKILLAAPTGKAALRMRESLANQGIELEAKTLHRLLGGYNSLDAKIIAIDECSMIDLPMMSRLFDAVQSDCDLYLLGDKNQLASVEAGSVFADICRVLGGTELTTNYRAKDAPGIAALSRQILENSVEDFNNENVRHFESYDFPDWHKKLFNAASSQEALEFLKTFQILCATKVGKNGAKHINEKLCEQARKENAKYIPIIITENNYQLNLFNGDVGVKDREFAYFPGEKTFPVLTLPEHEGAFAITIHKSQGSEYERVAVVYPAQEMEREFLTRELLYTAITRAKKECFIFGNREVLLNSCKRKIFRASGIK